MSFAPYQKPGTGFRPFDDEDEDDEDDGDECPPCPCPRKPSTGSKIGSAILGAALAALGTALTNWAVEEIREYVDYRRGKTKDETEDED